MNYVYVTIGVLLVLYAYDSILELGTHRYKWTGPCSCPADTAHRKKHKRCFWIGALLGWYFLGTWMHVQWPDNISIEVGYAAVGIITGLVYWATYVRRTAPKRPPPKPIEEIKPKAASK